MAAQSGLGYEDELETLVQIREIELRGLHANVSASAAQVFGQTAT